MSSKLMPENIDALHWQRLDKQWEDYARTLMERDGAHPKFENGGHNIKHNPLLRVAIEELRDSYMQLYHQQQVARLAMKAIERSHASRYPNNTEGRAEALRETHADPRYQQIQTSSRDAEYDVIFFTSQSQRRLQTPGLGFSEADRALILATAKEGDVIDPHQQLSKKDAMSIIGSIIKRSIDSYAAVFGQYKDFERPGVVHTAFKPPEAIQRYRSTPIERVAPEIRDWRSRMQHNANEHPVQTPV